MRIAFLSDAHGNPFGLAACLQAIKILRAQRIYFLGDAVGYFPDETSVLTLLKQTNAVCQKGNHEAMMFSPSEESLTRESIYQLQAAKQRLHQDELTWLESWPEERTFKTHGQSFWLIHGSPESPIFGYVYPDSELSIYPKSEHSVIVMANTHRPFVKHYDATLYINAGSAGLPRDQGNLASFAIYDTDTQQAVIYRVPFDIKAVEKSYGDIISAPVRDCLHRTQSIIVGEILDDPVQK